MVWRPWKKALSSPLKITNAASFGVPTIALMQDEPSFEMEVPGCYVGVNDVKGWLAELDSLGSLKGTTDKYKEIAKTCLETAERYHIDNNIKLFQALE